MFNSIPLGNLLDHFQCILITPEHVDGWNICQTIYFLVPEYTPVLVHSVVLFRMASILATKVSESLFSI